MRFTSCLLPGLLYCATYAALIHAASAAVVIDYNPAQIAASRVDGPYVIGSLFRVELPGVTVTHLGIQDVDAASDPQDPDGADGLTGYADDDGFFRDSFGGAPLEVGLWTADGATLLASATVSSSDPVTGSYRYVTLATPVALDAESSYLLGAVVGGGIEWFLDGGDTTVFSDGSGITLLENRFAVSETLVAPTNNGAGGLGRWAPANAQFSIIPEPSSALLWFAGSTALTLRRRRA